MPREIEITHSSKTYCFLQGTNARTNILYGSAGSGKSWSVAQYLLLEKFLKEREVRILVTGVTRPFLKKACWLLINDLISKYELRGITKNLTDLTLTYSSRDNQMFFVPLDDPEKLKSFEKINYIWCEEATFLSVKDYLQLHLRCRGENVMGKNKLYFSFNPIDEMNFFKPITENPPQGTSVNHSTYLDNEYLDNENKKDIERLIKLDDVYDKIYRQGVWATPAGVIYTNWDTVDEMSLKFGERVWGLDFGYSTNPAALIEMRFNGTELWEREHLYQTKLTTPDLIKKLEGIIEDRSDMIIADSAEPKTIEEIKRAGFNVFPCKKGKDSVNYGINCVRAYKTHLTKDSLNLIKEKRSYKWKEDKDGNVLTEPLKIHDHLMDAERYVAMHFKARTQTSVFILDDKAPKPVFENEEEELTHTVLGDAAWDIFE